MNQIKEALAKDIVINCLYSDFMCNIAATGKVICISADETEFELIDTEGKHHFIQDFEVLKVNPA
ncbi:hypothetical protein NX029_26195 [Cytobacillus firmus]|nr:hypothetical protein [Cytobacillus firmus]